MPSHSQSKHSATAAFRFSSITWCAVWLTYIALGMIHDLNIVSINTKLKIFTLCTFVIISHLSFTPREIIFLLAIDFGILPDAQLATCDELSSCLRSQTPSASFGCRPTRLIQAKCSNPDIVATLQGCEPISLFFE